MEAARDLKRKFEVDRYCRGLRERMKGSYEAAGKLIEAAEIRWELGRGCES